MNNLKLIRNITLILSIGLVLLSFSRYYKKVDFIKDSHKSTSFYNEVTFNNQINIDGNWKAFKKDELLSGGISNNDSISILNFNSPVKFKLRISKNNENQYDMYFVGVYDATPSFLNIYKDIDKRIKRDEKIAEVHVLSKNLIEFEWFGILTDSGNRWLLFLDEAFWGELIENGNSLKVKLKRENL